MPTDAFHTALLRVVDALNAGVGRNCGTQDTALELALRYAWAPNRAKAEASIDSTSFDNKLTDIANLLWDAVADLPDEEQRMVSEALQDVAERVRPAVEEGLEKISPQNFTMEPRGFSPPSAVSTFQWIAMNYVQQKVFQELTGTSAPLLVEEFLKVCEAGHLPVGWKRTALRGTLVIW